MYTCSVRKPFSRNELLLKYCFFIFILPLWKKATMYFFFFQCLFNLFSCSTGVWTQGLHLEPLCQLFFVIGFFWNRVSWTICPDSNPSDLCLMFVGLQAWATSTQTRCVSYYLISKMMSSKFPSLTEGPAPFLNVLLFIS
jgi:hypothetical protein